MKPRSQHSILVDHIVIIVLLLLGLLCAGWMKPSIILHPIRTFSGWFDLKALSNVASSIHANPLSWLTVRCVAYLYVLAWMPFFLNRLYQLLLVRMSWTGNTKDPIMGTEATDRIKPVGGAPPPFPNSWFRAVDSQDVDVNEAIKDVICGRHIVIFRDNKENVHILAANCANCKGELSQGKVVNHHIQCPSCKYQYNGKDGSCVNQQDASSVLAYHSEEGNGHIYMWHHSDNMAPEWAVMKPVEMNDGSWLCHGRTEHRVTAHLAEMPENGPDVAHLNFLHTDFVVPALRWLFCHFWVGKWYCATEPEHKHNAFVDITMSVLMLKKWSVPGTFVNVNVTQNGPGLVFLRFRIPFGEAYVIESVTPITPLYQKYHHIVWCEWRIPRIVGKGLILGLVAQAERDVPIWNHKTYENKPMLVKGDGPIPQFRRWIKQFYNEKSLTWDQWYHPIGFSKESILAGERLPCAAFVSPDVVFPPPAAAAAATATSASDEIKENL